jgi:lipoate-protein ligase A
VSWCFADTGAGTGAFNMRYDELLVERLLHGTGNPSVRVYQWSPWAVSLGYHQRREDIDEASCRERGIDVVRRPTGGRAILHAEELTYSVAMPADRRSTQQVYNDISKALVRGLKLFGVDVALQRSQPDFPERYRHASSIPCFTSSARYEIEWHDRKLVGSAQRRYTGEGQDIVLQHGSILCGPAHQLLIDFLSLRDAETIADLKQELVTRTADLASIRGEAVDVRALGDCIKRGFEQEWNITFARADAPKGEPVSNLMSG